MIFLLILCFAACFDSYATTIEKPSAFSHQNVNTYVVNPYEKLPTGINIKKGEEIEVIYQLIEKTGDQPKEFVALVREGEFNKITVDIIDLFTKKKIPNLHIEKDSVVSISIIPEDIFFSKIGSGKEEITNINTYDEIEKRAFGKHLDNKLIFLDYENLCSNFYDGDKEKCIDINSSIVTFNNMETNSRGKNLYIESFGKEKYKEHIGIHLGIYTRDLYHALYFNTMNFNSFNLCSDSFIHSPQHCYYENGIGLKIITTNNTLKPYENTLLNNSNNVNIDSNNYIYEYKSAQDHLLSFDLPNTKINHHTVTYEVEDRSFYSYGLDQNHTKLLGRYFLSIKVSNPKENKDKLGLIVAKDTQPNEGNISVNNDTILLNGTSTGKLFPFLERVEDYKSVKYRPTSDGYLYFMNLSKTSKYKVVTLIRKSALGIGKGLDNLFNKVRDKYRELYEKFYKGLINDRIMQTFFFLIYFFYITNLFVNFFWYQAISTHNFIMSMLKLVIISSLLHEEYGFKYFDIMATHLMEGLENILSSMLDIGDSVFNVIDILIIRFFSIINYCLNGILILISGLVLLIEQFYKFFISILWDSNSSSFHIMECIRILMIIVTSIVMIFFVFMTFKPIIQVTLSYAIVTLMVYILLSLAPLVIVFAISNRTSLIAVRWRDIIIRLILLPTVSLFLLFAFQDFLFYFIENSFGSIYFSIKIFNLLPIPMIVPVILMLSEYTTSFGETLGILLSTVTIVSIGSDLHDSTNKMSESLIN